jgi:hypothetical protein
MQKIYGIAKSNGRICVSQKLDGREGEGMKRLDKLDAALMAWAIICAAAFALLFWVWSMSMGLVGKI